MVRDMIIGPKISSDKFHWNRGNGVCDASDFGPIGTPIWGQMYDDACDVGIIVVSTKTGREVMFFFENIERDPEGDIKYYYLVSSCGTYSVTILND